MRMDDLRSPKTVHFNTIPGPRPKGRPKASGVMLSGKTSVVHGISKGYSLIPNSSIIILSMPYVHVRRFQNVSLFRFCVSELCTLMLIANAPLISMQKILLSDPIINHRPTIGSSAKIHKSLQLFFMMSCFSSLCHNQHKVTKI